MEINHNILKDSNDFEIWYKEKEKGRYVCKVGNHDTNKPLYYPCLIVWFFDDFQDVMYDFIYKNDIKDLLYED